MLRRCPNVSPIITLMLAPPLLQLHGSSLESLAKQDRCVVNDNLSSILELMVSSLDRSTEHDSFDALSSVMVLQNHATLLPSCDSYTCAIFGRIAMHFSRMHDLDKGRDIGRWFKEIGDALSSSITTSAKENSCSCSTRLLISLVAAVFLRSNNADVIQNCLGMLQKICSVKSSQVTNPVTSIA